MKRDRLRTPAAFAKLLVFGLALSAAAEAAGDPVQFSHSPIRPAEKTWVVETGEGAEPIEDISEYCVGCHGDLEMSAGERPIDSGSAVHSRPVGKPYPKADTDLVPLTELDDRILLVDGKVTCLSCHSFDAPDHRLVIEQSRGELCLGCHRK